MRKYEFRGISQKDKQWHYGSLFIDDNYGGGNDYYIECMLYGSLPYRHSEKVKEETIGQYTGYEDKNNKKIFEGDIFYIEEFKDYGVVKWNSDLGCYDIEGIERSWAMSYIHITTTSQLEIKGNIYDNPELVKETGGVNYEF